jgi:two-component system phosphate regulon sensor histidine kinase PhoR
VFRSIRWRIALPNVAVILLLATAFTVYFSSFMRAEYLESLEARLVDEVKLVAEVVRPLLPAEAPELTVQPVVERLGGMLNARVTVVRADGVVLGDTHEDPAVMNNHLQRPEIQAALADGFGLNSRYSSTLGYRLMYAAVPVEAGGTVVAIAWVSLPVEDIEGRIARMRHTIAVVSVAVAFLTGLSVLVSARSVTQPLRRLSDLAERMARGDMTGRI